MRPSFVCIGGYERKGKDLRSIISFGSATVEGKVGAGGKLNFFCLSKSLPKVFLSVYVRKLISLFFSFLLLTQLPNEA